MSLDTITNGAKVKFNYYMTFLGKDQLEPAYYSSISEEKRVSCGDRIPIEVELYT